LELDLPLDLDAALAAAGAAIDGQELASVDADLLGQVGDFIIDRVEKRLVDDGVRVDAVRAARAAELPLLQHLDELARAIDVEVEGGNARFIQVLEAQDRSRKLIAKAGGVDDGNVDESAFEADSERELHRMLGITSEPLATSVRERRFADAVALAAELGPSVDAFFSKAQGVMIMSDDETAQRNRLRLLAQVVSVTAPLGDLSELQV
ncbi:MAG: DALR anticodon-binding domain-containing protein, partial [Gaiellales bacterium]